MSDKISRRELVLRAVGAKGSQYALARELRIAPQMVNRWLNSTVKPSWPFLPRLARIAGISLDTIQED